MPELHLEKDKNGDYNAETAEPIKAVTVTNLADIIDYQITPKDNALEHKLKMRGETSLTFLVEKTENSTIVTNLHASNAKMSINNDYVVTINSQD